MSLPPETGDLWTVIRQLQERIAHLERVDRLIASSVGAGGLTVTGGEIVIKDALGAVQMTLSSAGLTLTGLLEVLGGLTIQAEASMRWYDDADVLRFEIGRLEEGAIDNIQMVYTDAAGTTRGLLGEFEFGGATVHGLLLRGAGGDSFLAAWEDEIRISRPGTPFDAILRVTAADGLRLAVDTAADGIQSGQVTAGAADSGGTGFRLLRIPN